MNWKKVIKQLEAFVSPGLSHRITYLPSGYRFVKDKKNPAYMLVDKAEIFNATKGHVQWYGSEQAVIESHDFLIKVTDDHIAGVRKRLGDKVPEDRLRGIAYKDLKAAYGKSIMIAQEALWKSNFQEQALVYLSKPVEVSLASDDILANIWAILDRRVGKKRLKAMGDDVMNKHPIVKYFYDLRLNH